MNLHIFSLCEHRARAPSDDGLDTVRLEGAPPQPADVNNDTPTPINWGDSVIEGEEIPVIAGNATLSDVATTMISMASGSVLVFDGQELLGVITLRDIVRAALQEPNIAQVRVEKYMTTHPWVVSLDWN